MGSCSRPQGLRPGKSDIGRMGQREKDRVHPQREEESQNVYIIEKSLGEGQPSPKAGKFRGARVQQVGTRGCWEDQEARSALVCKICTSVPCPGV